MKSYLGLLVALTLTLSLTLVGAKAEDECGPLQSVECTQGLLLYFGKNDAVACGQNLTMAATRLQPAVYLQSESGVTQGDKLFAVMVDPDAPSTKCPPLYWLHWMMTATVQCNLFVMPESQLVEYQGPTPPSGVHRYQLMLYKEPAGGFPEAGPTRRYNFDLEEFISKGNLGSRIATFQFIVQAN